MPLVSMMNRDMYGVIKWCTPSIHPHVSRINGIYDNDISISYHGFNEQGVLKAVKSLGRTFSYEVVKKASLPFKGYLPQHVPIAGAPRNTQYNDLFPAFITKGKLMLLAQK